MNEIDAALVIDELRKQLSDAHIQLAVARAEIAQLTSAREAGSN